MGLIERIKSLRNTMENSDVASFSSVIGILDDCRDELAKQAEGIANLKWALAKGKRVLEEMRGQMDEHQEKYAKQAERVAALERLWRDYEWCSWDLAGNHCPVCNGLRESGGHALTCKLAALLRDSTGTESGGE